jgi:DNA adenine methylase
VNGWKTILDELPTIAERLQRVELHCVDAIDLIERYDSPITLHYLDPPYLQATRTARNVYKHEMSDEDHLRLLDTITDLEGMVVLSGYRNPLYDHALKDWERITIEIANHAGQAKTKSRRVEVIWLSPSCDRFELR